ncbi:hypothetical protein HOY80DRAFT_990226, partial [Tuber brumale]
MMSCLLLFLSYAPRSLVQSGKTSRLDSPRRHRIRHDFSSMVPQSCTTCCTIAALSSRRALTRQYRQQTSVPGDAILPPEQQFS